MAVENTRFGGSLLSPYKGTQTPVETPESVPPAPALIDTITVTPEDRAKEVTPVLDIPILDIPILDDIDHVDPTPDVTETEKDVAEEKEGDESWFAPADFNRGGKKKRR